MGYLGSVPRTQARNDEVLSQAEADCSALRAFCWWNLTLSVRQHPASQALYGCEEFDDKDTDFREPQFYKEPDGQKKEWKHESGGTLMRPLI